MSSIEIWEDDDRRLPRGNYVIPCLLRDTDTHVYLKCVLLDLSASGCRVFTNDRRVRLMTEERLREKVFNVEFDFYDVHTDDITAKVINVHPGHDEKNERQFGLHFVDIDPIVARDINRLVTRDSHSGS